MQQRWSDLCIKLHNKLTYYMQGKYLANYICKLNWAKSSCYCMEFAAGEHLKTFSSMKIAPKLDGIYFSALLMNVYIYLYMGICFAEDCVTWNSFSFATGFSLSLLYVYYYICMSRKYIYRNMNEFEACLKWLFINVNGGVLSLEQVTSIHCTKCGCLCCFSILQNMLLLEK